MGLFDNIFLDQNSATAMLDPLLENGNTQPKPEEKKAVEPTIEAPVDQTTSTETPIDLVSFDDVTPTETIVTEQPKGFLSGGDPTINMSDDISFDIGGIDLPTFGDATSTTTDLSGGAGDNSIVSIDTSAIASESLADTSIALVQGATSATSDAIMETAASLDTPLDISADIVTIIPSELTTDAIADGGLVSIVDQPISHNGEESSGVDTGSGLMGLFASDDMVASDLMAQSVDSTTIISNTPDSVEIIGDNNLVDQPNDLIMPIITDITIPSTTAIQPISSADIAGILVGASHFSPESPLHEMLTEFITKLEKFNTESATLDVEMVASETALAREQDELKREFDVRMSAIEYKRKHMEQTREERKIEKSRLERIIVNLKQEVA